MDIESKLNQRCVYWHVVNSTRTGCPVLDSPVELWCRWENTTELFTDIKGDTVASNAIVYTEQDTFPEDFLWLGTLEDLEDMPDDIRKYAHLIRRTDKIPDIQAEEYLRIAYL